MGTVIDLEDGAELHLAYNGNSARRIAIVDSLTGSDPDAMLYDAYVALTMLTEPIDFGVAHPTIPNLVVTAIDPFPIKGCGMARVEITYSNPVYTPPDDPMDDGPATKTIRFVGVPKEYTTDPQDPGTDLVVSAPPQYTSRGDQIKTITVNESRGVIVFERTEPFIPQLRMRTYQNKINSVALGSSSEWPIGTIYCAIIEAQRLGAASPRVRYEFEYNADGFNVEYKWERPPLEVAEYDAGSRKEVAPYGEADFTALGFDWDD